VLMISAWSNDALWAANWAWAWRRTAFRKSNWARALAEPPFICWPLIGAIAFYSSYLVGAHNFWLSFVLLVIAGSAMYAPYGPFFAIITEILPANVAGGAIALINSLGALGSFAGSYAVGYLNGTTGGFGASYIFMAGSLFLSAILTIIAIKKSGEH